MKRKYFSGLGSGAGTCCLPSGFFCVLPFCGVFPRFRINEMILSRVSRFTEKLCQCFGTCHLIFPLPWLLLRHIFRLLFLLSFFRFHLSYSYSHACMHGKLLENAQYRNERTAARWIYEYFPHETAAAAAAAAHPCRLQPLAGFHFGQSRCSSS